MKNSNQNQTHMFSEYVSKLSPSLQASVAYLKEIVLSVNSEISEHIKWNSPAFYYTGTIKHYNAKEYKTDLMVINLKKNKIMCVLPNGMYLKKNTAILEGDYQDGRRLIFFDDLNDIISKENQLKEIVKEWLEWIKK